MKWIEALKEYNAKHGGKYVIPRKGTAEYDAVRSLMGSSAASEPKVVMPKKEYLEEHKRLDRVLAKAGTPEARVERGIQKKEVKRVAADPKPEKFIQEVVSTMKKGALTKTAKRAGMKPLEFAKEVVEHPEKHTETTRKRSQFLVNIQKRRGSESD